MVRKVEKESLIYSTMTSAKANSLMICSMERAQGSIIGECSTMVIL